MPIFSPIRTEVDACQVSQPRGGTTDNCQHLRVSRTDNNIQYHQCIKLSALLRPATSTISTAKETIVCAKVYDSRFSPPSATWCRWVFGFESGRPATVGSVLLIT